MHDKIEIMMKLQAEVNSQVNSLWMTAGNPWYRAIWTECAEMMDHVGWKWWKKQESDIPQVQLEIVDIWHFGLSYLIENNISATEIANIFERDDNNFIIENKFNILAQVEIFAAKTLSEKSFDVTQFLILCKTAGLSFDNLYKLYVGKNVLNKFRQDNGYKDGKYVKVWNGMEDNEWLMTIIDTLNSNDDVESKIYSGLKRKYAELTKR